MEIRINVVKVKNCSKQKLSGHPVNPIFFRGEAKSKTKPIKLVKHCPKVYKNNFFLRSFYFQEPLRQEFLPQN